MSFFDTINKDNLSGTAVEATQCEKAYEQSLNAIKSVHPQSFIGLVSRAASDKILSSSATPINKKLLLL